MPVQLCRLSWMLAALLLKPAVGLPAQPEAAGQRFQFTIARGSLSSVLEQFSRQAQLQIGTQLGVGENATSISAHSPGTRLRTKH